MSSENKVELDEGKRQPVASGEIDIAVLFRSIWNVRKLVYAAVFLAAIGFAGLVSFLKLAVPTTQTFQYAVEFAFPTAKLGKYPNGLAFARSDIIAPSILLKVYEQNELVKFGIKRNTFFSRFSVQPYAVTYGSTVNRYATRLNNNKLTFGERKLIENEMQKELDALSKKNALVRFTTTSRLGISNSVIEKILHDVVKEWGRFSIEQRAVLKLPNVSISRRAINKNIAQKYDPLITTELLLDEIGKISFQLDDMLQYSGTHSLTDSESGLSISELVHQLNRFEQFDISSVIVLAINSLERTPQEKAFLVDVLRLRLQELTQRKSNNQKNADAIEKSFRLYTNRRKLGTLGKSTQVPKADGVIRQLRSTETPQLGEGFIDKLIEITKRENDSGYRQNLLAALTKARIKSNRDNATIQKITLILEGLSKGSETPPPSSKTLPINQIQSKLVSLIHELNKYKLIAWRLAEELSAKRTSYNGNLYIVLDLPADKKIIVAHPILNKKIFLIFILTVFAAAVFSMFAGLLWQFTRSLKTG